jgi:hypothetical protein
MTILPVIEPFDLTMWARRHPARSAPVIRQCRCGERRKKRPAHEVEMPADGTMAARWTGEEFGTSRFKGSYA